MALLVSEKPLVLVALAGVPNPACRLDKSTDCPGDEVGPAAFDTGAAVVVVTGRLGVGALVVAGEPGFTVAAVGANEAGAKGVGGASGFEDFRSVDEVFAAVVVVCSLGASAVAAVAVVGGVVWAAVVVSLVGAVRGAGAGRPVALDLGAFRGALMVAAEAEVTVIPAAIEATAIVAVIHRAAVGKVRCWVMQATYELDLKPHWESENSFRQRPQRFLRLGS